MTLVPSSSRSAGGGSVTMIERVLLTGSQATIPFSGIAADYIDLMIVAHLRTDRAATADVLDLRLNGSSAATYYTERGRHHTAAADATEALAATSAQLALIVGNTAPASEFSPVEILIPNYAHATSKKTGLARWFAPTALSTTNVWEGDAGFTTPITAAVTSITLLPDLGTNFLAGCSATLYGLGSA